MRRREYLAATGIALTAPLVGCVQSDAGPATRTTDQNTDTTDPDTDTPKSGTETRTEPGDADDFSIDGRLHNDTFEPKSFTVAVTDSDGTVLSENERTVGPSSSALVPGVGQPGTTRTFEVTVGDATASQTLAFDVERTPRMVDGYVDIRYAGADDITIEFTPVAYPHSEVITADPRIDTPPHEITRPDPPDDPGQADEWNAEYLGENIATSPSLDFTAVTRRRGVLPPLRPHDWERDLYRATFITDVTARDTLLDLSAVDENVRQRLLDVDFDESVLVGVLSGYGSGSVEHRWARVEETETGIHLHGYHTDPYIQTDDLTTRGSLIEVERPTDEVTLARVSLTVSEERRVHFNSTEGVVTVDRS